MKKFFFLFYFCLLVCITHAEDGYRLWLRYDKIDDAVLLQQYKNEITGIYFTGNSATISAAKEELTNGLQGLLDKKIAEQNTISNNSLLIGTSNEAAAHSLITTDE